MGEQGRFARCVDGELPGVQERGDRQDVQDRATPTLLEVGDRLLDQEHRAFHIDVVDVLPVPDRERPHCVEWPDAGVVDEDVEPAELLDRARHDVGHVLEARHVGLEPDRFTTEVAEVRCGLLARFLAPTDDRDTRARVDVPLGDGAADATRPRP